METENTAAFKILLCSSIVFPSVFLNTEKLSCANEVSASKQASKQAFIFK